MFLGIIFCQNICIGRKNVVILHSRLGGSRPGTHENIENIATKTKQRKLLKSTVTNIVKVPSSKLYDREDPANKIYRYILEDI